MIKPAGAKSYPKMRGEANEILRLIDTLRFTDLEEFEYRGVAFRLIFFSAEPGAKGIIAWYEATADYNFDIHINEELAGSVLKRALLHEILEIHLLHALDQPDTHSTAQRIEEEIFGPR